MIAAGIIDPAKVTRSALQNAASIAALFLTTEAVVADKPEKAAAHGRRRRPAAWAAWTSESRLSLTHGRPGRSTLRPGRSPSDAWAPRRTLRVRRVRVGAVAGQPVLDRAEVAALLGARGLPRDEAAVEDVLRRTGGRADEVVLAVRRLAEADGDAGPGVPVEAGRAGRAAPAVAGSGRRGARPGRVAGPDRLGRDPAATQRRLVRPRVVRPGPGDAGAASGRRALVCRPRTARGGRALAARLRRRREPGRRPGRDPALARPDPPLGRGRRARAGRAGGRRPPLARRPRRPPPGGAAGARARGGVRHAGPAARGLAGEARRAGR